jgi:hypothetical protein
MIISVDELMQMPEFSGMSESVLKRKLNGIEDLVRAYTNNNFQNRMKRFFAPSSDSVLVDWCKLIKVGDTVQISESINEGLYVVKAIDRVNKTMTLDSALIDAEYNLVTKIEYPDAIVEGVVNLMIWEVQNRSKVGIQSETLSRHSVTYFAQDASNQLMGYPVTLLGFLKPYIKARF